MIRLSPKLQLSCKGTKSAREADVNYIPLELFIVITTQIVFFSQKVKALSIDTCTVYTIH